MIGTPVWFWRLSSPVRSWLAQHRPQRRVAFFCTMGGSGAQRVFATMAALLGKPPVATLALTEAQIARGCDEQLDAYVRSLKSGRAPQASSRRTRAAAHALAA